MLDASGRCCILGHMSTTIDFQLRRAAERAVRKAEDPWFGKRRKTKMEGNRKAARNKAACRGKAQA